MLSKFFTNMRELIFVLWFALLDIKRHKLRTFLTFLGFVVPVFMISLLITVLSGVKDMFVAEFSRVFGPDELMVVAPPRSINGSINDDTVQRVLEIEGVADVVPRIRTSVSKMDIKIIPSGGRESIKTIGGATIVAEPFQSYLLDRRNVKRIDNTQITKQSAVLNLKLLQDRLKTISETVNLEEGDILDAKTRLEITLHIDESVLVFLTQIPELRKSKARSDRIDTQGKGIDPLVVSKAFPVAAIFDAGFLTVDVPLVVIDLEEAKRLFVQLARQKWCNNKNKLYDCGLADNEFFNKYIGYSILRIRVDDIDKLDDVARHISEMFSVNNNTDESNNQSDTDIDNSNTRGVNRDFGNGVAVVQAKDALSFFNTFLGVLTLVIIVLGGIISLGSLLGLVNTILIAVLEKVRDIGVMRAFGAKLWQIMAIFIVEGIIITLTAGFVASLGVIGIVNAFVRFIMPNVPQLHGFQVIADYLHVDSGFVLLTSLITAFVGILASLYPAFRAARVDVIKVLRGE